MSRAFHADLAGEVVEFQIEPVDLPPCLPDVGAAPRDPSPTMPEAGVDLKKLVEQFENQLIRQALERTGWNKKRAAELLGIKRTTLVEMLKRKRILAA
jgi:DNA-binding NtrC family response regulator